MLKNGLIITGLIGTVALIGGVVVLTNKRDTKKTETESSKQNSNDNKSDNEVAIKDPSGSYKLFSDPSITKQPQKDMVIGNGQLVSLEYDGSKSQEGASLFYQLYYVNTDGNVIVITGGPFEGKTKGVFKSDIKIFTSDADGRPGFMEVSTVADSGLDDQGKIKGTNVQLGMYSVKFEVAE